MGEVELVLWGGQIGFMGESKNYLLNCDHEQIINLAWPVTWAFSSQAVWPYMHTQWFQVTQPQTPIAYTFTYTRPVLITLTG